MGIDELHYDLLSDGNGFRGRAAPENARLPPCCQPGLLMSEFRRFFGGVGKDHAIFDACVKRDNTWRLNLLASILTLE
jgi:hypothetical protein